VSHFFTSVVLEPLQELPGRQRGIMYVKLLSFPGKKVSTKNYFPTMCGLLGTSASRHKAVAMLVKQHGQKMSHGQLQSVIRRLLFLTFSHQEANRPHPMISLTKCLEILGMGMRRSRFGRMATARKKPRKKIKTKTRKKVRKRSHTFLRMMQSSLLTSFKEAIRKLTRTHILETMVKTLKGLTTLQPMESGNKLGK